MKRTLFTIAGFALALVAVWLIMGRETEAFRPIDTLGATPANVKQLRDCVDTRGHRPAMDECINMIYDPCAKSPENASLDGANRCAATELAAWQTLMDQSIPAAYDHLESLDALQAVYEEDLPNLQKAFTADQRAWEAYLEPHCLSAWGYAPSLKQLATNLTVCRMEMVGERTIRIRNRFQLGL